MPFSEPLPPQSATYRPTSTNSIQFDWVPPPEGNVDNYVLVYQDNDDPETSTEVIINKTVTTYNLTVTKPVTEYNFRLFSSVGGSDPVMSVSTPVVVYGK